MSDGSFAEVAEQSQEALASHSDVQLSLVDRRLVLAANLRLLAHRLRHNIPVLCDDLRRMLSYANDAGVAQ
jgi:hypothetical protein